MAFLDNQGVSKLCALLKDKFDSLWTAVNGKQGALTAGSNITISDGVISATDTTYTAGTNVSISNGVISATDTNTTYTAGTGINIDANNEISCTVSGGGSDGPTYFGTNALPAGLFWDGSTYTYGPSSSLINPQMSTDIVSNAADGIPYWQALREGQMIHLYASSNVAWKDIIEDIFGPKDNIPTWNSCYVWRVRKNNNVISFDNSPWITYNKNTTVSSISGNINADWWYLRIGNVLYCFSESNVNDALTLLRQRYAPWLISALSSSSLPSAPSNDGTYLLKCVVSSGTPTYSWESITVGGSY